MQPGELWTARETVTVTILPGDAITLVKGVPILVIDRRGPRRVDAPRRWYRVLVEGRMVTALIGDDDVVRMEEEAATGPMQSDMGHGITGS
jgi:hypothetical protein